MFYLAEDFLQLKLYEIVNLIISVIMKFFVHYSSIIYHHIYHERFLIVS